MPYTFTTNLTQAQMDTQMESIGDTEFPVILDGEGNMIATVMQYGQTGFLTAQKICESLNT